MKSAKQAATALLRALATPGLGSCTKVTGRGEVWPKATTCARAEASGELSQTMMVRAERVPVWATTEARARARPSGRRKVGMITLTLGAGKKVAVSAMVSGSQTFLGIGKSMGHALYATQGVEFKAGNLIEAAVQPG